MQVPSKPEPVKVSGITSVKPGSDLVSATGKTFKISRSGGVFVNKQGMTDIKYREELWHYYTGELEKSVEEYNANVVEKRNAKAQEMLEKATRDVTKPWWKIW